MRVRVAPRLAKGIGALGCAAAVALAAACQGAVTEPGDGSLNGEWNGALARGPCLGDWSRIDLTLEQSGSTVTGILKTRDGQRIPISGTFSDDAGSLAVLRPAESRDCPSMGISIQEVHHDRTGRITDFSGEARGDCCGSIEEGIEFDRALPR